MFTRYKNILNTKYLILNIILNIIQLFQRDFYILKSIIVCKKILKK